MAGAWSPSQPKLSLPDSEPPQPDSALPLVRHRWIERTFSFVLPSAAPSRSGLPHLRSIAPSQIKILCLQASRAHHTTSDSFVFRPHTCLPVSRHGTPIVSPPCCHPAPPQARCCKRSEILLKRQQFAGPPAQTALANRPLRDKDHLGNLDHLKNFKCQILERMTSARPHARRPIADKV